MFNTSKTITKLSEIKKVFSEIFHGSNTSSERQAFHKSNREFDTILNSLDLSGVSIENTNKILNLIEECMFFNKEILATH